MAMMTDKIKAGSKCKLNAYDKDLIQDEKKKRNIIDFSRKWSFCILIITFYE